MLNSIFTNTEPVMSLPDFVICMIASLAFGTAIAAIHMYKNNYSKNFILTVALLPAVVQTVIMLVNGNLGTGVAVMGAFSLVRFRSVPGTSREIISIFFAMAHGLATGMGYLGIGFILLISVGAFTMILVTIPFGERKATLKSLRIAIPEHLDYNGIFDDIFDTYTKRTSLIRVRTINMGSLYELQYDIELKSETQEKAFLDEIRVRNGNLSIVCGRLASEREEL